MKVLVIGSGGREHALAWRLAHSASVTKVWAAPGNPGIAKWAECLAVPAPTPENYLVLADAIDADLTVVGPEAPLVAGVVDAFRRAGRAILGPTKAAAEIEGSKIFAKELMNEAGIPTARYSVANTEAEAVAALARFEYPVVLKADGLAAGKGVIIAKSREETLSAVHALFSGQAVGDAGKRIVIEDFLPGTEVSFMVLTDGERFVRLAPTQDHKAVFDGDQGPNTGGMGAYCLDTILTEAQAREVEGRVIAPALATMRRRGTPFTGFLYAGLMLTTKGISVLEFNARLGDPETQTILHRLDGDPAAVFLAAANGALGGHSFRWKREPSVCVVMAAANYPGTPRTGDVIEGIAAAEATGAVVFQAGTRLGSRGLETAGGRVLGVTASGADLRTAIANAYAAVDKIRFDGMHFRRDIGRKGL